MAIINVGVREIHCKIVYYGPGMCGKTSNLQYIHSQVPREAKGDLLSIATETERTLFFDFLPLDLGKVRGFSTRFHLYTVPGQILYERTRVAVLNGADGVVFAAASFCDPALLDRPMLRAGAEAAGIPCIAFQFAENTGQFQQFREQAGTFADSIKLWGAGQ